MYAEATFVISQNKSAIRYTVLPREPESYGIFLACHDMGAMLLLCIGMNFFSDCHAGIDSFTKCLSCSKSLNTLRIFTVIYLKVFYSVRPRMLIKQVVISMPAV